MRIPPSPETLTNLQLSASLTFLATCRLFRPLTRLDDKSGYLISTLTGASALSSGLIASISTLALRIHSSEG